MEDLVTTRSDPRNQSPETPFHPARRGIDLLRDPLLNKGTAFTEEERDAFGLHGLLPPRVMTMDQQVAILVESYRRKEDLLDKFTLMRDLQDRNETLFYRVLLDHIEEIMPIIYTPVVGRACQEYSSIYRRPRGMFVSRRQRGKVREILERWPAQDIRVIVVTDGERILGLGDQGANGMGIPVGKLALYTACAGVPPEHTLPVTLDVGTNREEFLNDPNYLGNRERRITGAEYDEFVDEFIQAVTERFPKALVQFEDFANHNAFRLLERYRERICTFNDDIQGTAGVALAGIYSALKITGQKLVDQTILFHGSGEAAIGIGDLFVSAMMAEGMSKADAMARCWFMDSKALVESSRTDLSAHKKAYAHPHAPVNDLLSAVRALRPTALIGVSGTPKQFTREIVEEMARINERPVIFALSNPTSKAECSAEEAYSWSEGRAIFASGSPFPACTYAGKTFVPGQANNAYVFPGVGLGVTVCGATRVTDEMFFESARTLADMTTEADRAHGCLFPPLTRIREVSARIAAATAEVAYRRGLATEPRPDDLVAHMTAAQYQPVYRRYG
jgi:malate dehydrogenase (oxaloacetate-decarboxylating)(NADP+)